MIFSIVLDTASSTVFELGKELREHLESEVSEQYSHVDLNIIVGLRCLPETHRYKTFNRYTKKDKNLIVDIYLSLEEYSLMYKAEQRFNLGNELIFHLKKAFEKRTFEGLDSTELINFIIRLGREANPLSWFSDEMDWGTDLYI